MTCISGNGSSGVPYGSTRLPRVRNKFSKSVFWKVYQRSPLNAYDHGVFGPLPYSTLCTQQENRYVSIFMAGSRLREIQYSTTFRKIENVFAQKVLLSRNRVPFGMTTTEDDPGFGFDVEFHASLFALYGLKIIVLRFLTERTKQHNEKRARSIFFRHPV